MTPIKTPETNLILKPPSDWQAQLNGDCSTLFATRDGRAIRTLWKTTLRERLAILFGSPIRLTVMADFHPPVRLDIN